MTFTSLSKQEDYLESWFEALGTKLFVRTCLTVLINSDTMEPFAALKASFTDNSQDEIIKELRRVKVTPLSVVKGTSSRCYHKVRKDSGYFTICYFNPDIPVTKQYLERQEFLYLS